VDGAAPRALLLNGTVGAGKTTVAEAAGGLLTSAGVPHAVIDLDWLRRAWPSDPDDPFNLALTLRNLRCVARTYLSAGLARLVLAGVVESRAERARYAEAVGVELAVCRLRADAADVHRRLARRHETDPDGLRWHLARAGQLDAILTAADLDDVAVDASGRTPETVAAAVFAAVGWP
jgi:adenylylsulfate kinase